jgi:hypothetical protein
VAHKPPVPVAVCDKAIRATLGRVILSFDNGDGAVTKSKSARSSRQQQYLAGVLVLAEARCTQRG